tara:strand:- start:152 stop:463 length:312 start_codon:yes stop_codon:yes gene_type:complete
MATSTKYTQEQVNNQDGKCGCCGEKYEEGLYRNPWDCNDFGISRECIMLNMEDAYNENYKEGWDLDCDGEYWKDEYKKTLEEKIYEEKDGSKWKIVGNTSVRD